MIKQVIVWRKDLKVRKGKLAAQIAHASMKVFFDKLEETEFCDTDSSSDAFVFKVNEEEKEWINGLFTKIVVWCNNEDELLQLKEKAENKGILNALVTDSGKTEFNGIPTNTCLAIGPAEENLINDITGHLKLL